jgi:hypothetical protein
MSKAGSARPPAIPKKDLVDAADRLLSGLASLGLTSRAAASDAFEYWIWARTIKAARQPSLALSVRIGGLRGGKVHLRTSPSDVATGSYSHAEITGASQSVDLHTGVFVAGSSGAKHELDVVALRSGSGRSTPSTHVDLAWGVEAKLYASTKSLPLSIPRAVLGTAYDLKGLPGYHHGPPSLALVSSSPVSATGRTLLQYPVYRDPRVALAEKVSLARAADVDKFLRTHLGRI